MPAARLSSGLLGSLELTLANLRQAWPDRWPGLEVVLERCWQQLDIDEAAVAPRTARLLSWSRQVARCVELDGQRQAQDGAEPAYHSRLHIADALVSMTHLLLSLRQQHSTGAGVVHLEGMCLAIMTGHDFMHPGGSNAWPGQFEQMAIEALHPLMRQVGLDASDQAILEQCILWTDPLCVKSTHQSARQRPFSLEDLQWMTVLVQEADILASTLPQTQQSLTEALSREWRGSNPEAAAKLLLPNSRMMFLEHAALFSSPAAQGLGLNEVKQQQIQALRMTPKDSYL